MRFLIDMPVSPSLVSWLEKIGHQAVHAFDLDLNNASDTAIMKRAIEEGCVVITADLDFGYLLARSGESVPGVILFRGGNYSDTEMRDLVERVLDSVNEDTLRHAIAVVDKRRIRVTRLPLKRNE
jgi:predicted nuclease of predicted toxin-antitoxin system